MNLNRVSRLTKMAGNPISAAKKGFTTAEKLMMAGMLAPVIVPPLMTGSTWLIQNIKQNIALKNSYAQLDQYLGDVNIPEEQKRTAFEMLVHFAPNIAVQPALAANFIKKYAMYGIVDPAEMQHLTHVSNLIQTRLTMKDLLSAMQTGLRQARIKDLLGVGKK